MPIPLRTSAFWAVYRLVDAAPMQKSAETVRRASDVRRRAFRLPGAWLIAGRQAKGVDVQRGTAQASDGTELRLRIYRPEGTEGHTLPGVINLHGGGWVSGDMRQSEWWASSVAADVGVVVVSVDYRLAPEYPFPIPVEDCYDATAWVAAHAEEFGIDAGRIAVMGDSAGGNMAAAVSMMARDRGAPQIAGQVLIYPSVELQADLPSERENANAPILTAKDIANTPGLYFQGSTREMTDPYASPLRGKHEGLPPALIQTAQYDPLRDHGKVYADALRAADVPVRLTNYADAVHGYISLPGLVPVARQALAETCDWLQELFGMDPGPGE